MFVSCAYSVFRYMWENESIPLILHFFNERKKLLPSSISLFVLSSLYHIVYLTDCTTLSFAKKLLTVGIYPAVYNTNLYTVWTLACVNVNLCMIVLAKIACSILDAAASYFCQYSTVEYIVHWLVIDRLQAFIRCTTCISHSVNTHLYIRIGIYLTIYNSLNMWHPIV